MTRKLIIAFLIGVASSFIGGTAGIIAASPLTEDRTERVFVYGTLTNPLTRMYACVCWTSLQPVTVPGYAQTIRNIIPAKNSQVRGGIIYVSNTELARLDAYERVPEDYRREEIIVGKQYTWVYRKQ